MENTDRKHTPVDEVLLVDMVKHTAIILSEYIDMSYFWRLLLNIGNSQVQFVLLEIKRQLCC